MRVFVFSGPGGRVASICEKGERPQIALLLWVTQSTITPSRHTQSLRVCVCVGIEMGVLMSQGWLLFLTGCGSDGEGVVCVPESL